MKSIELMTAKAAAVAGGTRSPKATTAAMNSLTCTLLPRISQYQNMEPVSRYAVSTSSVSTARRRTSTMLSYSVSNTLITGI